MAWVKLTDRIHDNEKLGAVSDAAFRLWVLSISYSNLKLTDGHIPAARAKILVPLRAPEKTIAEVVDAKLWHRASSPCASCVRQRAHVKADQIPSGGYVIHHYFGDPDTGETYQRTRWVVEAERARLREAGRQGGLKSGVVRSTQLDLAASPDEGADEAHSSSSQVKLVGEAASLSPHAQESKLTGEAASSSQPPETASSQLHPVPRTPVTPSSGSIDPVPRAREAEPPIPDVEPGHEDAARSGSQGRREGWQQVGATAARIASTARGAR